MNHFRKKHGQKGFTLVELMIVVAIIGILAAIAVPLYANVQAKARLAKAKADARALASAVTIYNTHMGLLPTTLAQLTTAQINGDGQNLGPLFVALPKPPTGWVADYVYTPVPTAGTFSITATGDNTSVSVP